MKPDDANIAGNVHGGVILKLIEEAGFIISTKYCNAMMRKVILPGAEVFFPVLLQVQTGSSVPR